MFQAIIVLNNGKKIVCGNFDDFDALFDFILAIDTDSFEYNNIQIEKVE